MTAYPPPPPSGATRRRILRVCGLAPAQLALARFAIAQEPSGEPVEEPKKNSWKVSPESVRYIDKGPTGGGAQTCAQCHYFIEPYECMVVEGYVSPLGWCDFFVD